MKATIKRINQISLMYIAIINEWRYNILYYDVVIK